MYEIDFRHQDLTINNNVNLPVLTKLENMLHDTFINTDDESGTLYKDLKAMNLDGAFSFMMPYELLTMKAQNIPVL